MTREEVKKGIATIDELLESEMLLVFAESEEMRHEWTMEWVENVAPTLGENGSMYLKYSGLGCRSVPIEKIAATYVVEEDGVRGRKSFRAIIRPGEYLGSGELRKNYDQALKDACYMVTVQCAKTENSLGAYLRSKQRESENRLTEQLTVLKQYLQQQVS